MFAKENKLKLKIKQKSGYVGLILNPTMPQLLPFYFINQLSFSFLVLITMVYVFGTYILPVFAELFVTRMYITKL